MRNTDGQLANFCLQRFRGVARRQRQQPGQRNRFLGQTFARHCVGTGDEGLLEQRHGVEAKRTLHNDAE